MHGMTLLTLVCQLCIILIVWIAEKHCILSFWTNSLALHEFSCLAFSDMVYIATDDHYCSWVDLRFSITGEVPLCSLNGIDKRGNTQVLLHNPKDNPKLFCVGQDDAKNCQRFRSLKSLDDQGRTQYQADKKYSQESSNSLVFNTFIFLQVRDHIPLRCECRSHQ